MADKRGFGTIQKLASGRYQARYRGPDGRRHPAPSTFEDKATARLWLDRERALCENPETWRPPKARARAAQHGITFEVYANRWLAQRIVNKPLKPRTAQHYRKLLDAHILPTFGDVQVAHITTEQVESWHALTLLHRPTMRAHAYSLLRTILGSASVGTNRLLTTNPAAVEGAGSTKRRKKIKPASLEQLAIIVDAMPDRLQAMTLLAAWCGLRFGELAELRRRDVNLKEGTVSVDRAVTRVTETDDYGHNHTVAKVGRPKSEAGVRDVYIPPHLAPAIERHLAEHVGRDRDSLLFPGANGEHLTPSSLYGRKATKRRAGFGFYEARARAGRDDLRWHDLRHTASVLAAATGATQAELMARLGHSTAAAAQKYMHAAQARDREIAALLSQLADPK